MITIMRYTLKNYKVFAVLLLLITALPVYSQKSFEISTGIYTFSMGDMKSIQSQILNESEVRLEPVNEFPPFWAYNVTLAFEQKGIDGIISYIGGEVDYTSTGGRLSYSDYSGSYHFDQILKRFSIGGFYRAEKKIGSRYFLGAEVGASLFFSNTLFESYLLLSGNIIDNTNIKFSSYGLNGKVFLLQKFNISKRLYLINKVGFQLDIYESKLNLESDPNAYLNNSKGNPAKSMWTGLRGTLGLGININD